ncbi:MAG: FAD-dependent oxidoreductase [Rubrivivax sp.]|nr:FAD-dependent oxidoreductase [Rubrivivax sp.]
MRGQAPPALAALSRRRWLAGAGALLAGCSRPGAPAGPAWTGGYVGEAVGAGHAWRDGAGAGDVAPARTHRCQVLIVGAGIAGLAAARALRQRGIEDLAVLELHAQPGGNARGHQIDGVACPMGAHYLPVPDAGDHELLRWLHELGLARHELGRTVFDERHLCHSPQERVWHEGRWHEGLLPPLQPGTAAHTQAGRLALRIDALQRELGFALPAGRSGWKPGHAALDAQSFAAWLDQQGIQDPLLRWFLDYSCRDDYGAPADAVSAWAGIHYFASRHGFPAPGAEVESGRDAVFTWPQGNAWLVERLAAPLGDRLHNGWMVSQVQEWRDRVELIARRQPEPAAPGPAEIHRWQADQLILAVPLKWAVRLWPQAPAPLHQAAAALPVAPWLVANLHLKQPLIERPGVSAAWDSVIAGREGLGYVDALHQSMGARGESTVLTVYHALPVARRPDLLQRSWADWAAWVVADLAATHVDLPAKLRRVDLIRHGHAMAVPAPGVRTRMAALQGARRTHSGRVHWAHGDGAGYSVLEEAFAEGHTAAAAAALRRLRAA